MVTVELVEGCSGRLERAATVVISVHSRRLPNDGARAAALSRARARTGDSGKTSARPMASAITSLQRVRCARLTNAASLHRPPTCWMA